MCTTSTSFILTPAKPNQPPLTARRSLSHAPSPRRWPAAPLRARTAVAEGGAAMAERQSLYELLGVSESGSADEVRRAYKQLALKYHPDVSAPEQAEEHTRRFIEVHEAYETLSDPARRAVYDTARRLGFPTCRQGDEEVEIKRYCWREQWQDQLEGLSRRSMHNYSQDTTSWAARMRQRSRANTTI